MRKKVERFGAHKGGIRNDGAGGDLKRVWSWLMDWGNNWRITKSEENHRTSIWTEKEKTWPKPK